MTKIMYTEASPLQFADEELFLIEGTLDQLQIASTTVNLLEKIDGNIKAKSVVAGAAAAVGGMHGMVANAAAVALYDGEETYNFAGLLDERVICGTFQHADKIRDGDRVRAVVSRRGEVLFTHAIMNAETQEFYMPLNVFSSVDGLFRHCMRVATAFTIFGWIVFFGGALAMGELATLVQLPQLSLLFFLIPPLLMFPFEYWTYRTMRGTQSKEDNYGGAIFKVFGFPTPNKIDLLGDTSLSDGASGGWYAAWRADKLLKKLGA